MEIKRWQDFKKPGSQAEPGSFVGLEGFFKGTGENGYPGGIFDPLGLSKCASPAISISGSMGYSNLVLLTLYQGEFVSAECLAFLASQLRYVSCELSQLVKFS